MIAIAGRPRDALRALAEPAAGRRSPPSCDESRAFVERMDDALPSGWRRPATLGQLCGHADQRLGPFGADPVNLMFAVHGHVQPHAARRPRPASCAPASARRGTGCHEDHRDRHGGRARRDAQLGVRQGEHRRGAGRLGRGDGRVEDARRGRVRRGLPHAAHRRGSAPGRAPVADDVPAALLPPRDGRVLGDERDRARLLGHRRQGARRAGVPAAGRRGARHGAPVRPPRRRRDALGLPRPLAGAGPRARSASRSSSGSTRSSSRS